MNPTIADRLARLGMSYSTDPACAPGFRMIRQEDGTALGCFDAKGAVGLLEELETKESAR